MPNSKKIITTDKDSGQRLDVFLSATLELSRSQIQKMIETGMVLVNNKLPKKAGDSLREKDIIVIAGNKAKDQSPKSVGLPRSSTKAESLAMTVKIIAETPDYIVVNKPIGMLSHPTMAEETDTLADFITNKYPEIKSVGEDPARPGIVHRLDKEASGLMVIARTQKMFNHLKEQFKNRTIEKEYLALVHGKVAREWGEVNFPIVRSETAERMAAVPEIKSNNRDTGIYTNMQNTPGAREAKTEFLIEQKFINFTLLRVKIHTGRMHQIRVHMLAYNHPLVGDPLYLQKKQKRIWDKKLGRLFLHSVKLGFTDLAGEKQIFETKLSKELNDFLKLLS